MSDIHKADPPALRRRTDGRAVPEGVSGRVLRPSDDLQFDIASRRRRVQVLPNDGDIMVTITCMPDGKTVDIEPSETILNADLRANIRHAHACGGKAKCSTCRIAILDGLDNCPPR